MSRSIKWGILGSSATIAVKCVIPAIFKSKNGILHTLASRDLDKITAMAEKYDVTICYDQYEAVLDDPEVDAVYIPLPNHLHLLWTIKALEAGKHVLCEKPLARNADEAIKMDHAAKKAGRCLMEAAMYRFHPRSLAVFEMVKNGRIGTPLLVRTAFCFHAGEDRLKQGDNYRFKTDQGGGALMDVGFYGVSTARWLMDCEPITVQASSRWHENGVDVHTAGIMTFPGNGIAVVEASFISALQQTYTVVGSDGVIELPHNAYVPWEKDAEIYIRKQAEGQPQTEIIPGADEYQLMVEHFAQMVLEGESSHIPLEESINNLIVLDALAKAARSGRVVDLK